MSAIHYLKEQAARADQFARTAIDRLAVQLLQTMAREYPQQADNFAGYFSPRIDR
jgi:hypothetical protein